jgi:hypothetical protein
MDHEAAHDLYQTLTAYDSSAKAKQVRGMLLAYMLCGRRANLPRWRTMADVPSTILITCRVLASPQSSMQTDLRSCGAAMDQLCKAPRHKQSQAPGASAGGTRQKAAMPTQLMGGQRAAGTDPASDHQTGRFAAAGCIQNSTAMMTKGGPATAG